MSDEQRMASKRERAKADYQKHKEDRNRKGADYYLANKDRMRAKMKEWQEQNAEKVREDNRKRRERDGDRIRAERRQHYRDNKARYVANARKREEHIRLATPAWADIEAIAQFYVQAERMTQVTGIEHCVDHVYPLRGKTMCGLHVETNLQVIPAETNLRKSNAVDDTGAVLCCAWPSALPLVLAASPP